MQIVWGGAKNPSERAAMARWAALHIWPGGAEHFGNCVTMGVMDDGKAVACVVFHNWEPKAGIIELSGASVDRRWLTRPVINAMFDYVFIELGCQMAVMRVSARQRQKHIHRFLKAYGFTGHVIPRLLGRDEDCIVFTLTDEAWRGNKFNKDRDL